MRLRRARGKPLRPLAPSEGPERGLLERVLPTLINICQCLSATEDLIDPWKDGARPVAERLTHLQGYLSASKDLIHARRATRI
jgi:hypothetical protein